MLIGVGFKPFKSFKLSNNSGHKVLLFDIWLLTLSRTAGTIASVRR